MVSIFQLRIQQLGNMNFENEISGGSTQDEKSVLFSKG